MAWVGDCVTVGDHDYVYYGGYSHGHKVGHRQIGLAILRKNGFVSHDAGHKPGSLRTAPLVLNASTITVNANVAGKLNVRLLDRHGEAVPGYDWHNCQVISGDSIAHPVRWHDHQATPTSQVLSIEFRLQDAQLFEFDLCPSADR